MVKAVCAILLGLALAVPLLAQAAAMEAAIVISQADELHSSFVDALRAALPPDAPVRLSPAGSTDGRLDEALLERADLAIAVGYPAAEALARRESRPTLAVLVVEQSVRKLRARHPNARLYAIVLDQPPERQMSLIRSVLPDAHSVGVVLGLQSAPQRAALSDAATRHGLTALFAQVEDPSTLLESLDPLLATTDLILATPDPAVSNAINVRPMLLTTYRRRLPVFAYSQAYVDAGALAAVFSSPADIARQVADWLARGRRDRPEPPFTETPRYFRIAVNRQVARALRLAVPDDAQLAQALGTGRPQ